MKIALLGTGGMGTAIAARLVGCGADLTAWNRTRTRAEALSDMGVKVASTPADAVRDADTVIVMVTDAAAVQATLDQAAPALRPGACVVQMSTITPDQTRALVLPPGIRLIDAPVGGSVDAAREGRLTVLTAGDADALDRVTPVLEKLGTIRHCGGLGTASALKLTLNTALITALASLADALAVADAVGIDRANALDALSAGPLGAVTKRATSTTSHFQISLAVKDIQLALGVLRHHPAPVAQATAARLARATDQGADISAICAVEVGTR